MLTVLCTPDSGQIFSLRISLTSSWFLPAVLYETRCMAKARDFYFRNNSRFLALARNVKVRWPSSQSERTLTQTRSYL
jgi:hypothetical protein